MQAPNRASINQNDIMGTTWATVAVTAGQWTKIGEVIVPAGLYRCIGFGQSSAQSDATGRMYAKFADNTASPGVEVTGKFRISIFSPQDRSMYVIGEWPSAALDQNATDRTKQIPLSETQYKIGKDYKFVFEFKADAGVGSGTLAKSNTIIQIDMTDRLIN